ncbi:MAG TPA: orotidine-5'-phosphate decarboxylase [Polyangiales bacterium]|nr:orotidine-5'-phosphate decarboxylase [Polyangiales bacterium]
MNFADAVITKVRSLGHPLCVGLDPHLDLIPALFRRGSMAAEDPQTTLAVSELLFALLDRIAGKVAVIKPQSAFFEQLGAAGIELLQQVMQRARSQGLLVLLDAKRGDIGSTAEGYARAYLDPRAPLRADALTVNPYMGVSTLEPYLERCRSHERGLFVLVKTSNPGSADIQDLQVEGQPVFVQLASKLAPHAQQLVGPETGWSSLGVVVGATYPAQAVHVREALPKSLFLIPGYGAQGGSAADALRSFVQGPQGLEGGIVNSSRGIMFPSVNTTSPSAWEHAVDAALDQAISELGNALGRAR